MLCETNRIFKVGRCRFLGANICIEVLLQLKMRELVIQKKEYPQRFSIASSQLSNKVRKVVVHRNTGGGLGLSIKGGAEHCLPILVSKISRKDFGGHGEDSLHVGDAILEINGENVQSLSHGEVVSMLKCAGNKVEMKVKFYQPAFQYLTLQRDSLPHPALFKGDDTNEPAGGPTEMFTKQWTTFMRVPLGSGYVSRKCDEEEMSLENTLMVVNGDVKVKLQFEDFETFADWMRDLRSKIREATKAIIHQMNDILSIEDQITFMSWVDEEQPENELSCQKHISIKSDSIFLNDRAPNLKNLNDGKESYKIYECLLIKTGKRCIALKHLKYPTKVFVFNSNFDFKEFYKAWYECNYKSIVQLKRKQIEVSLENNPSYLDFDFESSCLSCVTSDTKKTLWTYKFFEIKGYCKHNNSRLSLELSNESGTGTDRKMIMCADVSEVLCCLNSFLTAKLLSLDPMFLLHL